MQVWAVAVTGIPGIGDPLPALYRGAQSDLQAVGLQVCVDSHGAIVMQDAHDIRERHVRRIRPALEVLRRHVENHPAARGEHVRTHGHRDVDRVLRIRRVVRDRVGIRLADPGRPTLAIPHARILALFEDTGSELLILARYMQILTAHACETLAGRAINIHHSFLPGFKGARPYYQAYDRGVKLIGATAHFVTTDLDEGPIIEQDVVRVDHTMKPRELERLGQDVESTVLNRAVRWHAEHRVFENGHRTIVLRH